ncbi:DUF3087 family protein [Halomonas piscis]|uniref:DUF3087 family protein n=1 Tax=Halomonas piscis TaxID=3031727 RepID=A0ABY9Z194_9GAMM|nr:DUF3087 family protein [Halomonas piscis]WNK20786.1 DUF3087 family protein [Halomonas piscis]
MARFILQHQDAHAYRRKSRIISLVMAGQFAVLGMLFALILTSAFGSSLAMNALGVVLGLLATSAMFAVLKDRPWMNEVRYAWQLKHHLGQVSGYLVTLRPAVEQDDTTALDILTFYHQGMEQLAELNGRTTDDDAERLAEKMQVRLKREALGLPEEVGSFNPDDLQRYRRA